MVKLTVPVGVVAPVEEVSVTVAVQLVGEPAWTDAGVHCTVVVVGWGGAGVTASLNEPLLVVCVESPAYVPVMRWWPTLDAPGV